MSWKPNYYDTLSYRLVYSISEKLTFICFL
nr:MAG TPA: hypothetical protein [Caudoviricetes sp.]